MDKVFSRIGDAALVELARTMIAIPSPNFEEGAVADFLAERMSAIGMDVQMMTVEHPTDPAKTTRQAIGRLRGTGEGPTLMYNGHTDVNVMMPGWSVDPHKGQFEDGWIWGLGAQDDKGGLAAALVAIEAIARSGVRLKGDLLYCPVATHKLGGTGTRVLLKKGVRADYCINIEHSANTVGSVIVGSVRVKLRTTTPGLFFRFTPEARAAYFNSIEQQALCLAAFGPSLEPVPEGGWLSFRRHPELPDFPMIRHDAIHKDHYGRGCDLVFQIRTVPGMTLESVRADVARVLDRIRSRHPTFDCEATIPANGPNDPFFMEPSALENSHPLVRAVADGFRSATGREPLVGSVERIGNFGDGNVLQAAGIPSVQFGPGDIKRYPEWPAPDERVHVDELRTTARTCAYAALTLCG
jgi:acetylornithine deacetylase/succinyl-diaminopimelate desuccinylase-like protein